MKNARRLLANTSALTSLAFVAFGLPAMAHAAAPAAAAAPARAADADANPDASADGGANAGADSGLATEIIVSGSIVASQQASV